MARGEGEAVCRVVGSAARSEGVVKRTLDDLRVQVGRDKVMVGDDVFEGRAGIIEQVDMATAAEGAQQPYAYVEWLKAAALCVKRAYRLGSGER